MDIKIKRIKNILQVLEYEILLSEICCIKGPNIVSEICSKFGIDNGYNTTIYLKSCERLEFEFKDLKYITEFTNTLKSIFYSYNNGA